MEQEKNKKLGGAQLFDPIVHPLSSAELFTLARIAGYEVEDRTPKTDAPGKMIRFSVIKTSDNVERTRGLTANEAWASFMTMYWRPEQDRNQCHEVIEGMVRKQGLTEVGNQLHVQYSRNREAKDHQSWEWSGLTKFFMMVPRVQLQAVLECPVAEIILKEVQQELAEQ